jgi:Uma2 family endonuclease
MSVPTIAPDTEWTLERLMDMFGPIPFSRIRSDPPPGYGTEEDVVEIRNKERRLYELIDGVLLEKPMSYRESVIAIFLSRVIGNFVAERDLGLVSGEAGMMRMLPSNVRIPDVAYVSWNRLPDKKVPNDPVPDLAPNLAVEVLSPSNTKKEMERKRENYFEAGVELVWIVDPDTRSVDVYTEPTKPRHLSQGDTLDGGDVLPGFTLPVAQIFEKLA